MLRHVAERAVTAFPSLCERPGSLVIIVVVMMFPMPMVSFIADSIHIIRLRIVGTVFDDRCTLHIDGAWLHINWLRLHIDRRWFHVDCRRRTVHRRRIG